MCRLQRSVSCLARQQLNTAQAETLMRNEMKLLMGLGTELDSALKCLNDARESVLLQKDENNYIAYHTASLLEDYVKDQELFMRLRANLQAGLGRQD